MGTSRFATALAVCMVTVLLTACGAAAESGEIAVADARMPLPAGANGAVYMTLSNSGDSADQLVSADADVAETVELHESSMEDGTMSMQQLQAIDIPAGGETVLEPGSLHIMLLGVDQDLAEGDTVDVTLTFDDAETQTVTAEVVPLGDLPSTEMGSEGHEMGSEPMEMGSEG